MTAYWTQGQRCERITEQGGVRRDTQTGGSARAVPGVFRGRSGGGVVMMLARPLIVAVLTFAVAAPTLATSAAANRTAARPRQEPAARQPTARPAASEAENLFWQSIMNSTNPAEFEAYLRRFPNGMFSELAQIRLEVLRTTAAPGRRRKPRRWRAAWDSLLH